MSINKKDLSNAIDEMVEVGQRKFETENERRVYAYGFVKSLLIDLALRDSFNLDALIRKYRKTMKRD